MENLVVVNRAKLKGAASAAVFLGISVFAISAVADPLNASASAVGATASMPATSASDYVISPDDTLEISVFQVPELTKTVQVDSAGKILLPLVGAVDTRGQTPAQLSDHLAAELRKKYMRDPQVSVTVKDSISQKFTVDGAVLQPGVYPVTGPTTLLQAVAVAKGPDPRQANTRNVTIFRMTNGARYQTSYNLNAIRSGKAADPPVYARDVIVVAGSGSKSFINNFSALFPVASMLRPW